MNPDDRPNPDTLLAEVEAEEAKAKRGKLKVFFGMSAGVGKTYAMLEEARRRAAEGLGVLVGYAEPHIRPDTEALLLGMDILPYKVVEYRGAKLKEFDLDAALDRKPALILVDELAHTNAPGMRHAKRWQDVADLLDAGISVYTTLNVQHLESVNDIVERVTGVRVQETLPDAILEGADEVELVDIAPEELLERFREGRVYRPEQAERAAKHFFTKGNLIALRELALRTTAQRVDAQMLDFRRTSGVKETWPASERVLVCVGPSPMSRRLVRSAKRLASGLRAEWIAAYVETPGAARLSERDQRRVEQTLRLAEQLGARTTTLTGERIAEAVVAYARSQNATKIVVGKPVRPRWRDVVFGSLVDDLIRRSGEIDIYVIRGEPDDAGEAREDGHRLRPTFDLRGFVWTTLIMAVTTAVGWMLFHFLRLENENVLMLYLLGVLWIATHHSRSAAVYASVLGVALFDFCFVPPFLNFAVSDQQYVVTFAVMLATALVISALTLRVRSQASAARQRERRTAALSALSGELTAARTTEQITAAAVRQVSEALGGQAVLFLPDAERRLAPRFVGNAEITIDTKELGVAQWVFEHDQVAGRDTSTLPAASGMYLPLRGSRGCVGVMGLFPGGGERKDGRNAGLSSDRRQLAESFGSQIALAVERAALAEEARLAWERVEAEFLRNTLLSGVSHELRTPLAAITGAASALTETGGTMSTDARASMLDTIQSEAERMERLVNNLLDMTRLEAGGLALKREWQPVQEVIGAALHHFDRRLQGRDVRTDLPADLPLVQIDGPSIEQVVVNLLDNAVEYTPANSPIDIMVRADGAGGLMVEVADRGPGLPPGTDRRVFDKFFRASPADSRRGIGLGLAICRAIVEAHGGEITAANRPGGGATFRFTLPTRSTPPKIDSTQ